MTKPPAEAVGFAEAIEGGKLFAPSAARNQAAITDLIDQIAPQSGHALEIASGTGQHIVGFAKTRPNVVWQPTDIQSERLESINAYVRESGLPNLFAAKNLNATTAGWSEETAPQNLINLSNLLHLISAKDVQTLISETAKTLAENGTALFYGPFMREGQLTSEGDQSFHNQLVQQDPKIGYKDIKDVIDWAAAAGLEHVKTHAMPANNLALQFVKLVR